VAHLPYVPFEDIPAEDRVDDTDNILRVHGVHSRVMRLHFDLYIELMRKAGPLTRVQREMLATAVSATNGCHY
jgi:alkylhydroperoxidase family enzyme